MSEKLPKMFNKRFVQGLALGLILSAIPPVYSWSVSDNVCDLNAAELHDIVAVAVFSNTNKHIVKDAIGDCYFPADGGYPEC